MARAKRTDRSEARRRFRQKQLEQAATQAELDEGASEVPESGSTSAATKAPARRGDPARTPGAAQPRPGVFAAFRAAAEPADIRADIRALRSLARTRAVLVPAGLVLAALVATFALAAERSIVAVLAFQAFLAPPPMAASFLAGILTPRAGWLLGGLAGIAAGVAFAIVMLVAPDATLLGLFRASAPIPAGFRENYALQALAISPLMGIGTGAFAGFYRRFLRLASPQGNRQASRPANRGRKAATRR